MTRRTLKSDETQLQLLQLQLYIRIASTSI